MGKPPSFVVDIRPLFTAMDIDHMSFFCDLSNYSDVKKNATTILGRLDGSTGDVMPPAKSGGGDGPWPKDKIDLFREWKNGGCQP